GEFRDLFQDLLKRGFVRARVDGEFVNLGDDLGLKKHFKHTIEVVIDRLVAGKGGRTRLAEAVEQAIRLSGGTVLIQSMSASSEAADSVPDGPPPQASGAAVTAETERLYSAHYACAKCNLSFEPPSPQLFSFNSPLGMCKACTGLGARHDFLLERLLEDETKSLWKGALNVLGPFSKIGRWRKHIYKGAARTIEKATGLIEDTLLKMKWCELPEQARQLFLYGTGDQHVTFAWRHAGGMWKHGGKWDGIIPELLDEYIKGRNPMRRKQLEKYMEIRTCSSCGGTRLNPQARSVRLRSTTAVGETSPLGLSLPEVCGLSIEDAAQFFTGIELDDTQRLIAEEALKEIRGRLGFLERCGLNYLALDRSAPTLSGGESQRIRLAGQIGSGLVGVLYIQARPRGRQWKYGW
ncbi:MAG: excinuclease ABC subunit A, partial [Planctomycetaceae bacterium]|nr:excinuclease ABC subunit A [Planctomycetaceae bacterium]